MINVSSDLSFAGDESKQLELRSNLSEFNEVISKLKQSVDEIDNRFVRAAGKTAVYSMIGFVNLLLKSAQSKRRKS